MFVADKIRGSLIGGAAGDALGYTIEFLSEETIFRLFGSEGIQDFQLFEGEALISDDTQMTLFTANALVVAAQSGKEPLHVIRDAYLAWYQTQTSSSTDANGPFWWWTIQNYTVSAHLAWPVFQRWPMAVKVA